MKQNFVDVWYGQLTLAPGNRQALLAMLNDSERQKARSFKLEAMSDRHIAARGLLRQTLASYLPVDPAGLQFELGEHGKPGLACASLHFNLSHTADTLLIAIADFADIGVDIEAIRPRSSLDSLARRCFSEREFQHWRQLPPSQQMVEFYRLWTKKEAFVKAVGRGIALGLEQCELEPGEGGGLLSVPAEYGPATAWKAIELRVEANACAALVTPNRGFVLRRMEFELIAG